MLVIVVESVTPRLRGRLGVRMLEVRAGVYVGRAGQRLRARIWEEVKAGVGDGNAVMAYSSTNEQGFLIETLGANRRIPVDWIAVQLVAFKPPPETPPQAVQVGRKSPA